MARDSAMGRESNLREISIPTLASIIPLRPGRPVAIHCLNCDAVLTLCQPDVTLPDRFVGSCDLPSTHGSCDNCQNLHVICMTDSEAIVMLLPPMQDIRDAIVEVVV